MDFSIPPGFEWPVQFCIFSSAATYIVSIITSNVSQVDRLWTFLPTIYTAYFALLPLWPREQAFYLAPYTPAALGIVPGAYNPRAIMMLSLIVLWMFRLSYNTWRRGLFDLKDEDYRWAVLRSQLHPVLFQIVNLSFISIIQNVLLLLLGIPTFVAATQPVASLGQQDYAVIALSLLVLALEFTADNQQFAYQSFKHDGEKYDQYRQWPGARLDWTVVDKKRGFLTRGLWAWARHPNFACEQSFWWIMTLAAPNQHRHIGLQDFVALLRARPFDAAPLLRPLVPLVPAIALSALFLSSTLYSEAITGSKYPAYAAYKRRVAMFSPLETLSKSLRHTITGRKAELDGKVWGNDVVDVKGKGKME